MDLEIEKIHNILIEANLPSSIKDLKNPTEEFVVDLINTFLRRFHIYVGAINNPLMEQQDIMEYIDDSDIIGLINLHTAMVQICDRIYFKDLCITDISSPGSKKIRKFAKFLANFILFANNKESDIEEQINEIQNRAKLLHDMIEKKNEVLQTKNEKALYIGKQLSLKEKYISEIQKLQSKRERNNKKDAEVTAKETAAKRKKQQAVELCGTYKAEVSKLHKKVTKLQSEIIESPDKYEKHLKELEKQQSSKVQERKTMEEACQDKKHLMEQQTNIFNFVQKQLEKLVEVQDIHQQLKKVDVQEDNIKKQVDMLRTDIANFEKRLENQKGQREETEVHDIQAQYEERLSPLRNLNSQLLSDKKLSEVKLEEMKEQYNEGYLKLDEMRSTTQKLGDETTVLIKNYQDLYDNEILTEKALWETWSNE